jgi:hypothetical protein
MTQRNRQLSFSATHYNAHGRSDNDAMKLDRLNVAAGANLLGLTIIAASIAFTFRWTVAGTSEGAARLDRWTGEIVECRYDVYKAADSPLRARILECDAAQHTIQSHLMMLPPPESKEDFERRMDKAK